MIDLNRMFRWLSIRSKLLIAFAGLSVIPVGLLGLHGIFSNVKAMKETAFERLTHDVRTVRENTENFLVNVETDLRLLQNAPVVRKYTHFLSRPHRGTNPQLTTELIENILSFASTKQIYFQIRIVSEDATDIVHIEAVEPIDSVRRYDLAASLGSQHDGISYYFLLADEAGNEEIAFAPAELASRTGNRVPVISFVAPLVAKDRRVGLLIANVFAKDLFGVIEDQHHFEADGRVALVSSDGHYLYDSEKKKDWNRLLASRENDNLQHDYPARVAQTVLSGSDGLLTNENDHVIAFAPLFPFVGRPSIHRPSAFFDSFFVLESISRQAILAPARSFAIMFAASIVLFLGAAIILGLIATRQFTTPIAMLQAGADVIAKGNYSHRLDVKTHDEIEQLASQFNSMAASLESHELEISRHRINLEDTVRQRTKELVEEKTKLQAIIDNVPSAFLVLDKDFTIKSASSAFARVTGCPAKRVEGANCLDLLSGSCDPCPCRNAARSGQIETRVNHLQQGGIDRFIEHMVIPIKEGQEITSFLEIITDITKRKRLEQRLVQTERLSAAGELSALIAHEFRNGLTSVKMILQLQHESKRRTVNERKSLGVALESILQMERIVTELLNFAKPSPLRWSTVSLSDIIADSLHFIQPRIDRQRISVRQSFDPSLPRIQVDAGRLKEALVNILVNAIQAIGVGSAEAKQDSLSISVRRTQLQQPLKSFSTVDHEDSQPICLQRGTECAVIQIEDSGCGIPAHLTKRIFDPFFTTKSDGTGLGLPMVSQTVAAHGGVITVTSTEGQGTTFRIHLPISARNQTNAES